MCLEVPLQRPPHRKPGPTHQQHSGAELNSGTTLQQAAPLNSSITVIRPVEATDVAVPTITATSTILLTSRMRASMV